MTGLPLLQNRLAEYGCRNEEEELNAIREFVYASDRSSVELWSREFFTTLVEKMPWRN